MCHQQITVNNILIESQEVKNQYIEHEKKITLYNLDKRIVVGRELNNNVVVEFNCRQLTNENIKFLFQLHEILADSGELGSMEYDIFKLKINSLQTYEKNLIKTDSNLYL